MSNGSKREIGTLSFSTCLLFNEDKKNQIGRIRVGSNGQITQEEKIKKNAVEHFQNIFKWELVYFEKDFGLILPRLVIEEMNDDLLKDVSLEEVEVAIFGMGRLKSPGPDGFLVYFIKITGRL